MTTRLIVVGGFLGAGKTTLLWEAAQRLVSRGLRVGLITNDQAPELVDTTLLMQQGLNVAEVTGSCFCCNFRGFLKAAENLATETRADVLIAEPVGSCTDLSATILQPLKDRYGARFVVAPFSVLADPVKFAALVNGRDLGIHPGAAYIVRKQLEEADLIAVNKSDLLAPAEIEALRGRARETFPKTEVQFLSARDGRGVDQWLSAVLAERLAGTRIAEVDYDTYAEGEAALGWLNADIELRSRGADPDWPGICRRILERLKQEFVLRSAAIGHVKLVLTASGGYYMGNLTSLSDDVSVRGKIAGSPDDAHLVLNARVEMRPTELEAIVRGTLAAPVPDIEIRVRSLNSFTPGRPRPTFRYDRAV